MSKVNYPVRLITPASETEAGKSNLLVIKSDDGAPSTLETNLSQIAQNLKPNGNFVIIAVVSEISALLLSNVNAKTDIGKSTSLVGCRVIATGQDCRFVKPGDYCFPVTNPDGSASGLHIGSMIPLSDNPISLARRIEDIEVYSKDNAIIGGNAKMSSSIRFAQYYYLAEHMVAYVMPKMTIAV